MGLAAVLGDIVEEGRRAYAAALEGEARPFYCTERIGPEPANQLVLGDNLDYMVYLLKEAGMAGKVDLIYIDPPFFSRSSYKTEIKLRSEAGETIPAIRQKAYHDVWDNSPEAYLRMLAPRFFLMRELLSEEGSIFVHLDWHASHAVKLLLDEIFGEKNFVNEIIWHYKSGGVSKRHFARKHDTILFYGKSRNYYFKAHQEKSYNRDYRPYRFKGVREYKDEVGWYTMVNRKDVWRLDMVGRTAAERTGYVTQKPEALVARILESCTRDGDLVADFFGGSGTTAAAAEKMGRRWISCDIGSLAALNSHKRLMEAGASFEYWEAAGAGDGAAPAAPDPSAPAPSRSTAGAAPAAPARVVAAVAFESSPLTDKILLSVELAGYYHPAVLEAPVEAAYRPTLRHILEKDPLQLVDYWCVDTNYDGAVFCPAACFNKENEQIETRFETLGNRFGRIAVKAVDIFGNSALAVLEPAATESE